MSSFAAKKSVYSNKGEGVGCFYSSVTTEIFVGLKLSHMQPKIRFLGVTHWMVAIFS